jgi:hypothetical protein
MQRIIIAGTVEYLASTAPEVVETHAHVLALRLNSPVVSDDPRLHEDNSPQVRMLVTVQHVETDGDCARRLPWTPHVYAVSRCVPDCPGVFLVTLELGFGIRRELRLRLAPGHYPSPALWQELKEHVIAFGRLLEPGLQCWLTAAPEEGQTECQGDMIVFGDGATLREALEACGIRQRRPFTALDEKNLRAVLHARRGSKTE